MNDDDDDLLRKTRKRVEAFSPLFGGGFLFANALTRYHHKRKDKAMIAFGEGREDP